MNNNNDFLGNSKSDWSNDWSNNNLNNSTGYSNPDFESFTNTKNPNPFIGAVPLASESTLFKKVFRWMFAGLGISAISAIVGESLLYQGMLSGSAWIVIVILELVLVFGLSFGINKMSSTVAKVCFILYSFVNGLSLSLILTIYTASSVFSTFIGAAAMFGVAAIYASKTNRDLSKIGPFFIMGLFGILIASIINIFMRSSGLEFLISVVGIVVFIGLTLYDVDKIKQLSQVEGMYDEGSLNKIAIIGALQLYLDFVNLFLKLLRFMGKRKD